MATTGKYELWTMHHAWKKSLARRLENLALRITEFQQSTRPSHLKIFFFWHDGIASGLSLNHQALISDPNRRRLLVVGALPGVCGAFRAVCQLQAISMTYHKSRTPPWNAIIAALSRDSAQRLCPSCDSKYVIFLERARSILRKRLRKGSFPGARVGGAAGTANAVPHKKQYQENPGAHLPRAPDISCWTQMWRRATTPRSTRFGVISADSSAHSPRTSGGRRNGRFASDTGCHGRRRTWRKSPARAHPGPTIRALRDSGRVRRGTMFSFTSGRIALPPRLMAYPGRLPFAGT